MTKSIHCYHCGSWCYADDPYKENTDVWCLLCARWQAPPDFKPLPFVVRDEEPNFNGQDWYIDSHGDIIDIVDKRIEAFIATKDTFTVTSIAKKTNCSTSEAYMTLQRLMRNGLVEQYVYGPLNRWRGYRHTQETTWLNNRAITA